MPTKNNNIIIIIIITIMKMIIIIIIIINKQITNILTNTEDSGNHCTKKNFTQFSSEEIPLGEEIPLDESSKKSAETAHHLTFSLLK